VRRAQFVAMMRAFHVKSADCGIRIAEFRIQSERGLWPEIRQISKAFCAANRIVRRRTIFGLPDARVLAKKFDFYLYLF